MGLRSTIELYRMAEDMAERNRTPRITEGQLRGMRIADGKAANRAIREAAQAKSSVLTAPQQAVVYIPASKVSA